MPVTFDVYLFRPEFIEEVTRKELKNNPRQEEFDPEIGSVYCLNVGRQAPIYFYSIDELLGLIDAGFEHAHAMGQSETKRELERAAEFPEMVTERAVVELTANYQGSLRWEDEEAPKPFSSRDELKHLLG